MKKIQPSQIFGLLSYGIGVALGFFLIFVATWADLEASAYEFPRLANAGLGGFRCPVLMTPDETNSIFLDISNPTEGQISPSVKTLISTRLLPEEFLDGIQLAPGESKRLEWTVDAENIDLGSFIFAKVLLYSAYPLPTQEATCGILILNIPGTGRMIVPVLMALSLISMGWGLYRLSRFSPSHEHPVKHTGSLMFLAILIGLGLLLSFIGGWIFSLMLLVIMLLLIIVRVSSLLVDKAP
jgi:hypothetical protein